MRICAVVQARMSSKRLPGKVLSDVEGRPLLDYLIERLQKCTLLDGLTVATSNQKSDDPIARYCERNKIDCARGSLENVASRFFNVIQERQLDVLVRINADSPLLDPKIVDMAVSIFRNSDYDLVTNVQKRTFPKGQSVEVVRAATFRESYPAMKAVDELEHPTKYFYKRTEQFKIFNLASGPHDYSSVNLCVDTAEDFDRFIGILKRMNKPVSEYHWEEIVALSGVRQETSTHV